VVQLAQSIGYAADELAQLPDGANMGLSCGNPVALASLREGEVVLDLGSGGGFDVFIAGRKVGPTGRAIGVDMTPEMLALARKNAVKFLAATGLANVEFRQGQIEQLPVEDAGVDVVISNCVINLSPDKPAVFREVARVMKPGARFTISDIVVSDLPAWLRESAAAWSACVAGAISEEAYLQGLREAGLAEVEVTERLVYDASQLKAILSEDIPGLDLDCAQIEGLLKEHAGKVWSAKFTGRKPA